MASFFPAETLIVANDVVKNRAKTVVENIDKWGADNVVVTNNDPKHFCQLENFFDLCLIDAPCSGEGLFRKNPETTKQWSLATTNLCSQRQRRILMDVWNSICENGIVIYSTCTYNPAENEENLLWLSSQKDIEFIEIPTEKSWKIDVVDYKGVKGYRFLPHKLKSEGFFISAFRKISSCKKSFNMLKNKQIILSVPKNLLEKTEKYFTAGNPFTVNNQIVNSTIDTKLINILNNTLHVIRSGCKIATIIRDELKPEHPSVLSCNFNIDLWKTIVLNSEQVGNFYRKATFDIPRKDKGWYVLLWNNLPVGYVHILCGRINTSLPVEQRMLKDFTILESGILCGGFKAKKFFLLQKPCKF